MIPINDPSSGHLRTLNRSIPCVSSKWCTPILTFVEEGKDRKSMDWITT